MKCPKCGYLGFEHMDRCRNCGYDFALVSGPSLPDLSIRTAEDAPRPLDDIALVDRLAASGSAQLVSADMMSPGARSRVPLSSELPLFAPPASDDAPLITKVSPPRQPLAVRRATPEVPRLRAESRPSFLDMPLPGLEEPPDLSPAKSGSDRTSDPDKDAQAHDRRPGEAELAQTAGLGRRLCATIVDLLVLAAIDLAVVYFTVQICGITFHDLRLVPKVPLATFLLAQNIGYFVAFTAGGQTLGKMVTGIRVVSDEVEHNPGLSQALIRTLVWSALAMPAGLGFLSALFDTGHRGFHDRLAGTRVVRASA